MSVSILGPNAFSIRRAISPDKSALPLSRLDSAGREKPRISAAPAIERPSGPRLGVKILDALRQVGNEHIEIGEHLLVDAPFARQHQAALLVRGLDAVGLG